MNNHPTQEEQNAFKEMANNPLCQEVCASMAKQMIDEMCAHLNNLSNYPNNINVIDTLYVLSQGVKIAERWTKTSIDISYTPLISMMQNRKNTND